MTIAEALKEGKELHQVAERQVEVAEDKLHSLRNKLKLLKNSLLWCNKLYSSLFSIGSFREIKSDNDHKKRKLFGLRAVVVLLSWSCIFRIRTTCDAAISNDNLS